MAESSVVKQQNPLADEWDYLFVLDACRYDTFADVYDEYLSGRLEKRESIGSSTPEWAAKTFTERHDILYFSSNPFINSLGVPLNELPWGASCDYDWTATDHIATIVDLWQSAWDDDLGTVPPENVNDVVLSQSERIRNHERTIIHYMQPHVPYLVNGKGYKLDRIRTGIQTVAEGTDGGFLTIIGERLGAGLEPMLETSSLAMKVGMWLEVGVVEAIIGRKGTRAKVETYYEQNLRRVLSAVADVVTTLDGRIIVTADHGEAFGEHGVWEHHIETHIPPLIEVPWLVLE